VSSTDSPVTVVDVGGSYGDVAISLARKYPKMTCIVQDLPKVISSAKIPEGLEKQLTFMGHDFFKEQPVKNADVYFLKWILHDWSDTYCNKILKALTPAMKKGARVVINEFILPEPGTVPLNEESTLR
jgi:chemotaxis methyl-accepting protein methylase